MGEDGGLKPAAHWPAGKHPHLDRQTKQLHPRLKNQHLCCAWSLKSGHVVIGSRLLSLLCKASGCGGGKSIYRASMWCNLASIWKQNASYHASLIVFSNRVRKTMPTPLVCRRKTYCKQRIKNGCCEFLGCISGTSQSSDLCREITFSLRWANSLNCIYPTDLRSDRNARGGAWKGWRIRLH